MAPNLPPRNARPPRPLRSPMASAAILLGFYIAMYLAIAAAVRLIDPASADDVASDAPAAPLASAPVPFAGDAPAREVLTTRRTATAPDCRSGPKADLLCAAD